MSSRVRLPETEKITINLGLVDLGQIDLLVREGFFTNRTDFIRSAIRAQLSAHQDMVRQTATRNTLIMGLQEFCAADLMAVIAKGERLTIRALGLVRFANDVSPELVAAAIESIDVLGALQASPGVRSALLSRMK